MRVFIVESLGYSGLGGGDFTGYIRSIARRHFLRSHLTSSDRAWQPWIQRASTLCLCVESLFILAALVVIGTRLGERATSPWLIICVLSVPFQVFITQPLVAFVNCVIICRPVGVVARELVDALNLKSRLVLMRQRGLLRDSNAMIQHFNPGIVS